MTDQQAKRASSRANSANNIEEQLIPILKELLSEVRRKATDESKWSKLDKALAVDLDSFNKLASNVRNSLMRQQWKGDTNDFPEVSKDCPKDPYLANMALQRHIVACAKNQQDYRTQIIAQEEDFAAFEAVVVQNVKVSLATFYDWRSGTFEQQVDQIKFMQNQLKQMDPERDWSMFKNNNDNRFLVVPSEFVQPKRVQYDGFDDPGVQFTKQGKLLRKEGVFKRTYKNVHVVLTSSSYFHSFADGDLITPELSIDLMECTLVPLMMNEKEPEEIALVGKSGMFGRDVKHKFRGENMAESAEWWGAINEQMRKTIGTRNLPTRVLDLENMPEVVAVAKPATIPAIMPTIAPVPAQSAAQMASVKTISAPKREVPIPVPVKAVKAIPIVPAVQPVVHNNSPPKPIENAFVEPISNLSLSEKMEIQFQNQTAVKKDMEVPQYEVSSSDFVQPVKEKNAWDTYDANDDGGGW